MGSGSATAALASCGLGYLNHSAMLSVMRVHSPPAGSALSATSGERMTTSPPGAVTVNSPMVAPAAMGAMSGCLTVALVCRLANWPRGTVTYISAGDPAGTGALSAL